jgi:hypothetical protein
VLVRRVLVAAAEIANCELAIVNLQLPENSCRNALYLA